MMVTHQEEKENKETIWYSVPEDSQVLLLW